ncbi:MAG: hypothetical protein K2X47_11445 [Bdellovibrionales bacterium]|nr:hypothetical protein [Bdellovibrionales bacterium]
MFALIELLTPKILVRATAYGMAWEQKERDRFLSVIKPALIIMMIGYVGHHYFVDRPQNLEWGTYRFSMAALALVTYLFYRSSYARIWSLYRVPAIVTFTTFCISQSMTIEWYSKVPYLYSYVYVFIVTWILQLGVGASLAFAASIMFFQWPYNLHSGEAPAMLLSAGFVSLALIAFVRIGMKTEIQLFIAGRREMEAQQKTIELELEFTDQILRFLPKEIVRRIRYLMSDYKMSVLQAVDEVLRLRSARVAALFSDIRGFTRLSREFSDFQQNVVAPNMKESVSIAEKYEGVPRQIADLIVSYFDSEDYELNVVRATLAALEIVDFTQDLNQVIDADQRVIRFAVVTCGEATVGNFGGTLFNREVTAMGTCMNQAQRIDEMTKAPAFRSAFKGCWVILTESAVQILKSVATDIDFKDIDLPALRLVIRDFPELDKLWAIEPSMNNIVCLSQVLAKLQGQLPSHVKRRDVA